MRYVYNSLLVALMMFAFTASVTACEMRSEIRDEIRKEMAGLDVDLKDLEDRIHDAVHSRLDRERDRLRSERDRLRDERRKLERERRRTGRHDHDDDEDSDWGSSAVLALGLYGVGAFLLTRQSRQRGNTE